MFSLWETRSCSSTASCSNEVKVSLSADESEITYALMGILTSWLYQIWCSLSRVAFLLNLRRQDIKCKHKIPHQYQRVIFLFVLMNSYHFEWVMFPSSEQPYPVSWNRTTSSRPTCSAFCSRFLRCSLLWRGGMWWSYNGSTRRRTRRHSVLQQSVYIQMSWSTLNGSWINVGYSLILSSHWSTIHSLRSNTSIMFM